MGRKKKKTVKPWCWYCNREFDDDKVLTFHQKAKHFKCHICHKKLFSAPGLAIHCSQVHKETVSHVPNAVPGRDNIEVEIFGMEGIPEADRIVHELQKTGKANVSEPDSKRPKLMGGVMVGGAPPPGMMYPVMPGMGPPGVMPPMAPLMPGMVPPPAAVAPPPMMMQQPPPPHSDANSAVPPRPLFPGGAQPGPPPSGPPNEPPKPIFPAYQNTEQTVTLPEVPLRQANKIPPVGAGCKLIHPEIDLSMEELRSQSAKYRTAKVGGPPNPVHPPQANSSAPAFMGGGIGSGPNVIRPGMPPAMMPPAIRPGMGPPPMMQGPGEFNRPPQRLPA